jgi:hypothetical protein
MKAPHCSSASGEILAEGRHRPAIHQACAGDNAASWYASGAGSLISLPGLTNLIADGDFYSPMNMEALAGGQVLLGHLQTIPFGTLDILSDGAGSTIDVSALSGFVLESGQGQVTAQNGGTILFDSQGLLLANVAINIPHGNPLRPPTLIAPSTLALYGQAWQSYQVEEINTLAPGRPSITFLVPLTNSFQSFASAPPPNTAFVVSNFVANPPILQLGLTPDNKVQLLLYGLTNATYQIQSATNLLKTSAWTTAAEVTMTNAFYFLPETPPAGAAQFYRAKQQ